MINVQELLLRKYNSIDYILNLEFKEGYEFILRAFEVDFERSVWEKWLVDYTKMDKKNFKSFDQYKNDIMKPIIVEKQLSKEELLQKANDIQNKISRKDVRNNGN